MARPLIPINDKINNQENKVIEELESNILKLKNVGPDFDEILLKMIDFCEQGYYFHIVELVNKLENENMKMYLRQSIERLFFIVKFPFSAQENKIFHKKLERNMSEKQNEHKPVDYRRFLTKIYLNNPSCRDCEIPSKKIIQRPSQNNLQMSKNEEKTEDNLIYMLQRSEEYLDNPALEDLCNPFSSKEFIEDENLINFDENFSFTYQEENILGSNNFKEKDMVQINENSKGMSDEKNINEAEFNEMESIVSEKYDDDNFKLAEIQEKEEFEEN